MEGILQATAGGRPGRGGILAEIVHGKPRNKDGHSVARTASGRGGGIVAAAWNKAVRDIRGRLRWGDRMRPAAE